MTTAAIVASVWAALSGLALMFVRGATAKPSRPPQPEQTIRVYRDGLCEVWARPDRARGRGPVKVGEE